MNCALLPNNTSSQEYHQRLTHPALGQTSGFTNSMYEDVPLSTSVDSGGGGGGGGGWKVTPPPPLFQSPGLDVVLLLRLMHVNESLSSPVVCDLCTLPHLILG